MSVCVCPLSLCGHIQIINAYILLLSHFAIEISSAGVFIHTQEMPLCKIIHHIIF